MYGDVRNIFVSFFRYTSGSTHTSDALKYARETAFKTQNGMRPNAAKIAIVITDGKTIVVLKIVENRCKQTLASLP